MTVAEAEFDQYAAAYDESLAQGLSVTGEDKEFYARGRLECLRNCLGTLRYQAASVLDFGCGTGSITPLVFEMLKITHLIGTDVSRSSIRIATASFGNQNARFFEASEYEPSGQIDLAYCNGVYHHIPVAERAAAADYVFQSLRPGGVFAFWENNPWNPGTRYIMSRVPFDHDAITLTPPESRRLLQAAGFQILRTDYCFLFPHALRFMRPIERRLQRFPFGGQYQVLAVKPSLS